MAEVISGVTYALETFSPELAAEVMPLLEEHYRELDPFIEYPLDPDWDQYFFAQAKGAFRAYIARDADGEIIGYSACFIQRDLHHRTMLRAVEDVFYIAPDRRGFGFDFLLWRCEQLQAEGVKVDFQAISTKYDWGTMARRAGFEPIETMWAKRL